MNTAEATRTHGKTGLVLHGAARYDLTLWLLTFARERVFENESFVSQVCHSVSPSWM